MARVAGVNLPDNKRVVIGLQSIYGVGPTRALMICRALEIKDSQRVRDLVESNFSQIRSYIESHFKVEGDLMREVSQNIKRKTDLGSYQGLRHRRKLPVRGQRTHTNARTRKGKAQPIAGKKG